MNISQECLEGNHECESVDCSGDIWGGLHSVHLMICGMWSITLSLNIFALFNV